MTALKKYARLESGGLWRADTGAQRRDVIVSFGSATLVLSDSAGRPLTHWSLPALARLNPGERPALFTPDPDGLETLEIDDSTMIDAIETVRHSVHPRAHRGRLRLWVGATIGAVVLAAAVLWLPGALTDQVIRTMPASARAALDARLEQQMARLTGATCHSLRSDRALSHLNTRIGGGGGIRVLPGELPGPIALPGGLILLDRAMIEIPDDPAGPAGQILIARLNAAQHDPLRRLLARSGIGATLEALTTGTLSDARLAAEAEALIRSPIPRPPDAEIARAFETARVPLRPWARDDDITGARNAALLDGASQAPTPPLLSDGDWVALQGICGG